MVREIAYEVWDVFTDTPFGGNPLGVVADARGIDSALMQTIAREFGYSETVFMLPPGAGATIRLRIFTPSSEIPFAGHPTIGAAASLARAGRAFGREVPPEQVIEEGIGLIRCETAQAGGIWTAAFVSEAPFEHLGFYPAADIAACLGLPESALTCRSHTPQMASKGLPFVFAEAARRGEIARAAPVRETFRAVRDAQPDPPGFFSIALYCREAGAVRMRVFAPLDGIDEDPATGSAAAALAAMVCDIEGSAVSLDISQGSEMGRPSRILASAERPLPHVSRVRIAGSAVPIMAGVLTLAD
jgi:trans-2,3-dihydro-3-hydroxyanthranilate isomerase